MAKAKPALKRKTRANSPKKHAVKSQRSSSGVKGVANLGARRRLAERVIEELSQAYPEAHCALDYSTPAELLFATILSAQCTDVMVNKVTKDLFPRYPTPAALAKAEQQDVEQIVRRTGFYRNKAKNLIACAQALVERHGGEVPQDLESLTKLPGAGRKTANVVLGNAFGIPGMVVDTHVMRLSQLIGLVDSTTPEKIELELMELVPKEHWTMFSHWLISHGRAICIARRPKCGQCVIQKICEYGKKELAR